MGKIKEDLHPLGSPRSWARTPGTYISGQAHIDGADQDAVAMELKWGAGRLRLLVSPELREKLGRRAHDTAHSRNAMSSFADKFVELYRECFDPKQKMPADTSAVLT